MLSVILPAYNEEKMVGKAAEVISGILEQENIEYELIFVNDGSKDRTWEEIKKAAEKNIHVRGLLFFKKFWKRICNLCRTCGGRRRLLCRYGL